MPTALIVEDEPLLRQALREQVGSLWPEAEIHEASDGVRAAQAIAERLPDVLFLDIHLPGLSGLEIARLVSGRCHVVFVTAHQEHAVRAFEEGAVDFLVKPVERDRLAVAVERVRQRLSTPPPDLQHVLRALARTQDEARKPIKWIHASAGKRIHLVPVNEVHYFQSDSKYTKVVTATAELLIRRSVRELAESLDGEVFWQVHRGVIVNATRIESVVKDGEQMHLRLAGRPERFAVSQAFQHRFRERR